MEEYQFNEESRFTGEPTPELKIALGQMWGALNKFLESYNAMLADRGKMNEDTTSLLVVQDALRNKYTELDTNYTALLQSYDDLKLELQELRDVSSALPEKEEKITYFEQKIRELEDNNAYLVSLVGGLEKEKADFEFARKDIANKNHELHNRSEKIQALQTTISELESKVIELNNFRKDLGIQADGNFDQESVISHLKQNLDKAYLDLQIEKSSAKEQEQRFLDELAKYKQIWKAQESTLEDYSRQLIDKNRIVGDYEKQTEKLNKERQDLQSENLMLNNELKRQIIEIEKLKVIQNEIDIKDKRIEELEEQLFGKDADIENLNEKIKNLGNEISQKSDIDASVYKKMKIDLDNKDILVSNLSNRIKYLNESIQAYELSIKELTAKVSGLETANETIQNEYKDVSVTRIGELEEILAKKDAILDEFSITLMSAESKAAQYESELNSLKSEMSNSLRINSGELDRLQSNLKQKESLLDDYMEEIISKNRIYVDVHEENYALGLLNDKLEKELEYFANKLNKQKINVDSELENLLKDKDALISEYERELEMLKDLKFSNYNTIQKLQEEIADVRAKYGEMSSIYEAIYKEVLDLRDERNDYDANIEELEQKAYTLEARLEFKSREADELAEEYAHYNQLKDDLRYKNKLVADYSAHIKYLNNLNLQYFNTIKDNNGRIIELEKKFNETEIEFENKLKYAAGNAITDNEVKYNILLKDYSEVMNGLLKELNEKNTILSEYQTTDYNYSLIIRSKDDIIRSLGDKIRHSEVQLMRKDEIINENYNQIKDLNSIRISNKELIISLQESISRLERELELKEEELNTNQHNYKIIDHLKLQVEAKSQILNDYSEQIMNLQELGFKYQMEINQIKEKITFKEKEIADKDNLIEILKEEISDRDEGENATESKIALLNESIHTRDKEIAQLKSFAERVALTNEISDKLNKVNTENLMLRKNIEELKSGILNAREKTVLAEKGKYSIENELANLKNEYEDLNSVFVRLQQNLQSREEVIEALEVKIAQLEHSRSKSDLKRIILIDKIEKYMDKLEKVININN